MSEDSESSDRFYTAFGLRAEAASIAPGLHVVATPIGNLKDISFRALETLAAADHVIAEDTRTTKVLLSHYGVSTPLTAYHEHNARLVRPHLLARLATGAKLALVSDAGTPLVSDPGYKLVQEAITQGVHVTAVPGASAILAALIVAGLPTDRFFFEGFLPHKSAARRARLTKLAQVPGTLVFFESPRRLVETLVDCAAVLGPRPAAVARELTKFYESVKRGALTDLAQSLAQEEQLRGEIVLLIAPPEEGALILAEADLDAKISAALAMHSARDAADIVAAATGHTRRHIYARILQRNTDKDA
jgi:16S rRNA (cytidine1402-2'-O)-methyltransferase